MNHVMPPPAANANDNAAYETLYAFFERTLLKRDVEGTLALLTDDVHGIGAGLTEIANNRESFRQHLTARIAGNSHSLTFELSQYKQKNATPDCVSSLCALQVHAAEPNKLPRNYYMHVSACFRKVGARWLIDMIHISEPSLYQKDGGLFPMQYVSDGMQTIDTETKQDLLSIISQVVPGGIVGVYEEPGYPLYVANERLLKMAGYSSYQEFSEDIDGLILNCIHPDDRDYVVREVDRCLQQNEQYELQYRMKRRDGTYFWVYEIGRRTMDGKGRAAIISILSDITDQVLRSNRLEKEVVRDPLTGVYNRRGGEARIAQSLTQPGSYAFLVIDLDNFKRVNDNYGHTEGDKVLRLIAQRMQRLFDKTDMVCRIGGDEFVVLTHHYTDPARLEKRLHMLIASYADMLRSSWPEANSTLSVGGVYGDTPHSFDELYRAADEVLYEVKRSGKGQVLLRPI